jgi:ArsR family transcriptional regulator, arsenate/arsenite/antimonite-responsive transcriptional repressor
MDDWRELRSMVKALADIARLAIVYHLAQRGEITVTALTGILGLSQPLASWHLRKLRRAGLVHTRRVGRQVYCSLDAARYRQCLQRLEKLVDPAVQPETFPSGEQLVEQEGMADD